MAKVRFYYDVEISEDDVREAYGWDKSRKVTRDDLVSRATSCFSYGMQDHEIRPDVFHKQIISTERVVGEPKTSSEMGAIGMPATVHPSFRMDPVRVEYAP